MMLNEGQFVDVVSRFHPVSQTVLQRIGRIMAMDQRLLDTEDNDRRNKIVHDQCVLAAEDAGFALVTGACKQFWYDRENKQDGSAEQIELLALSLVAIADQRVVKRPDLQFMIGPGVILPTMFLEVEIDKMFREIRAKAKAQTRGCATMIMLTVLLTLIILG